MKPTILLFALIFACAIPTYSQMNRHRKTDATTEQFSVNPNKKNDVFGNYKFVDKFGGSLNDTVHDSFTMLPILPAPSKYTNEIYSGNDMPCLKPEGIFSIRIYKPD